MEKPLDSKVALVSDWRIGRAKAGAGWTASTIEARIASGRMMLTVFRWSNAPAEPRHRDADYSILGTVASQN